MNFLRSVILWKHLLKHYNQREKILLPITSIMKLRLNNYFMFKIVYYLLKMRLRPHKRLPVTSNNSNIISSEYSDYSGNTIRYIKSICATIPDYDVLAVSQPESALPAYLVSSVVSNGNCNDVGTRNVLRSSALLAYSIGMLYDSTTDSYYKDLYCKLLNGISSCILVTTKMKAILKHPNLKISKQLGGVAVTDIAALVLLLSTTGRSVNPRVIALENKVTTKILDVLISSDYLLKGADNDLVITDFKPNARYNLQSCLVCVCVSFMANTLDIRVFKLAMLLLDPGVYKDKSFSPNTIVTANLIEAVYNIATNHKHTANNNWCTTGYLNKFVKLGIAWIEAFSPRYDTPNAAVMRHCLGKYNPELESILVVLYSHLDMKPEVTTTAVNVHKVINVLKDCNIVIKNNSVSRRMREWYQETNNLHGVPPRVYNEVAPSYWNSDAETVVIRNIHGPVYEYLTPYARVLKRARF